MVDGIDEPCAVIAGFETAVADPTARGPATEAVLSPDSGAGTLAKAEFRSAVIRSYIRLGRAVVGRDDALAVGGEDDVATAEPETFVVLPGGTNTSGFRIVLDEGLVETLEVGFWTPPTVCLLLNNPCVPPGVVVGVELCRLKTVFPAVRLRCRGIALPDRAEVACRVGVSVLRCWVADLSDDGFAFPPSTPPISVS